MRTRVYRSLSNNYLFYSLTLLISFITFGITKYYYPFPSYINDSYYYLDSAISKSSAGIWPIGYSLFIRIVGIFSHYDNLLIVIQYLIYCIAAIYFYLILVHIFSISKWIKLFIYLILFINPAVIYLNNCILSDSLFISISLIWFTQLIRFIIFKQINFILLVLHLLVILTALSLRYQAFIFPLISITSIIILTNWNKSLKIYSTLSILITTSTFVVYSTFQTKKTFGVKTFSVFSGWQLANNALIGYMHHVPNKISAQEVPIRFRELQQYIDKYAGIEQPINTLSGVYIWNYAYSPLAIYATDKNTFDRMKMSSYKWIGIGMGNMEKLYKDYGIFLIKKYPYEFLRYYCLLNFIQYIYPRVECMNMYNRDNDKFDTPAVEWFGYKDNIVLKRSDSKELEIFNYYGLLFFISYAVCWLLLIAYFYQNKGNKEGTIFNKILFLLIIYLIINIIFSVFAAPIVLRYQIFNLLIINIFSLVLIQLIISNDKEIHLPISKT